MPRFFFPHEQYTRATTPHSQPLPIYTTPQHPGGGGESAAIRNERAGLVGHGDVTDIAGEEGVTVTESDEPGRRIITESVAGQVVGEYMAPAPVKITRPTGALERDAITIGEAVEATAISAGDKPVDQSDAVAIQAAEVGVAATAQSAASMNERIMRDENKMKLGDVLTNATVKMPADKAVTREDAEGVIGAELRNNPSMATHPGGVPNSVAAAVRLNQQSQ